MKPVNREILRLALPSILANITIPLVGMVDTAVAGHLGTGTAAAIGGIAIGSMLFDLLYWNFGFLRVGTGGLTAQAFGRRDMHDIAVQLSRGVMMSMVIAAILLVIQWFYVKLIFLFVSCSPEVQQLASKYFFIRIWAAPATLSLMALRGWFIGMQDSVSSMKTDLVVNGVNILGSIVLTLGLRIGPIHFDGMGYPGIAVGTVLAQYCGLATAAFIIWKRYSHVFMHYTWHDALTSLKGTGMRAYMSMNADLFVRSLCFIAVYIGYTVISARYGDNLLASASIMMKLLMIFSYFTDGFAYAGEAMTGKYIGAGNVQNLKMSVKWVFVWSLSIAALFTVIYWLTGTPMLKIMTNDADVVETAQQFIPWLMLMPLFGCTAFTWDGIWIGATASRMIRNTMLWSVAAFFTVWIVGRIGLHHIGNESGAACMHLLMGAYFAHLLARSVYQTVMAGKAVPQLRTSDGQ